VIIISWIHFRETAPDPPLIRATILPPDDTTFAFDFTNGVGLFAVSPDGRKLVLTARGSDKTHRLWLRSVDSQMAQPLPGTEGATYPFWSPDSRWIGFFSGGRLKKLDTAGGPPVAITDAIVGRGGTWNKDNVIVFARNNAEPLYRISANGGPKAPVTKYVDDEGPQRLPWFLPVQQHFLYRVQGSDKAIRVGSLDSMEPKIIGSASSNAIYAGGHLFFRRDTTLMAQPFDAKTLTLSRDAVPIAENVNVALST